MAKIDLNDYLEKLTEPEDRETVANRAYQRELFEQYVTKDGNFPEQRAQLLEDFRVGKELTGPKGLRRKLGAFDLEYFGRAYLAHYFVRPSPKFHGELDRIWREGVLKGMNPEVDAKRISRADGCRRAIEAPRGHAKSTTFTFKDDLHAAVYGYKHYIKNAVSGAVTWFFESGKRIVSTFANGIKSAFSSAVEAVKGGLQKIRNLLPFSDAKEGPLSTLTLSGQRTMTTYAHGLTLAGDAPAEAMNKSLQQVQGALDRKPEKKVDLGGGKKDKDESSDEGGSGKGKQVIIHKLLVPVDLKKIKDLQQLLAILQEVEDYAAANEDGEPGDDEDAVPAPA